MRNEIALLNIEEYYTTMLIRHRSSDHLRSVVKEAGHRNQVDRLTMYILLSIYLQLYDLKFINTEYFWLGLICFKI